MAQKRLENIINFFDFLEDDKSQVIDDTPKQRRICSKGQKYRKTF